MGREINKWYMYQNKKKKFMYLNKKLKPGNKNKKTIEYKIIGNKGYLKKLKR